LQLSSSLCGVGLAAMNVSAWIIQNEEWMFEPGVSSSSFVQALGFIEFLC